MYSQIIVKIIAKYFVDTLTTRNKLASNLRSLATFHDMDLDGDGEITKEEAAAVGGGEEGMLVLPPIAGMKRIAYSIYEVDIHHPG